MLAWIFKEKWFWIIVLALASIIILPFIVLTMILNLPPILRVVATIALVLLWAVAGAYKEWIRSKPESEKKMQKPESA
jgi:hypothetical protein